MDFEVDETYLSQLNEKYKQKKIVTDKKVTKKKLKHINDSDSSDISDENDPEDQKNFERLINVLKNGTKEELLQYTNSVLKSSSNTDEIDSDEEVNKSCSDDSNQNKIESDREHFDDIIQSDYETDEDEDYFKPFDIKNDTLHNSSNEIKFENIRHKKSIRIETKKPRLTKRAERKERKEKELKERLKEIEREEMKQLHKEFAKNNPDLAERLKIDEMDPDFDLEDCLKKIAEYHNNIDNEDDLNMERPVFSDEDLYEDEVLDKVKKRKSKKLKKKTKVQEDLAEFNEDAEKPGTFKHFYKQNKRVISLPKDKALGLKFNYDNSEPLDFGLAPDEILHADDKELNQYASLKKIKMRFRGPELEERDKKKYSNERMLEKKKVILKSVYVPGETEEVELNENEKKKKSKKRKYNLPEYGERFKSLKIKKGYYNHKLRKAE